jgi:hypothetical protein
MDKSGQLALLIFRAHALFEFSDGLHQPVGIVELFKRDLTLLHNAILWTQKRGLSAPDFIIRY